MEQETESVTVTVLAVSPQECGGKPTWETATAVLRNRLQRRFGEFVRVRYVELFTPESFDFSAVMQAIQEERYRLPVVLVGDEVISNGSKLSEGTIARHIRELLPSHTLPQKE